MTIKGFLCGKFWVPHLGHMALIDYALYNCDQLYISVVESAGEEPDGFSRYLWLKRLYPQAIVSLTQNDIPDTHEEWAIKTVDILGFVPDRVFTSEEYGLGWAAALTALDQGTCEHWLLDLNREMIHISGTMIRSNPIEYWDMMHPSVRAHYAKRAVIVGAESAGKTTLARQLASHFHTKWVPEWARIYGEEHNYSTQDWAEDDHLFEQIVIHQPRLERQLAEQANKLLICDTDLLATAIWYEAFYPTKSSEWLFLLYDDYRLSSAKGSYLYLLMHPTVPWINDGTRTHGSQSPDEIGSRPWFTERFRSEIMKRDLPLVEIDSVNFENRTRRAIEVVHEHLNHKGSLQIGVNE